MSIIPERLESLIEAELAELSDKRVLSHIRGMLVAPHMVLRDWDYGQPGQQYPCWFVLRDQESGAEIAYCEQGFGPRSPWGLVSSADAPECRHMGMDSGWFTSFLDAFFDSFACVALPIWKVIRIDAKGTRTCLTDDGPWEITWQRVYELRERDRASRYDCGHDITYR
ncbi:hypothetical protein SSBR45G_28830 [Bradyrhizobium sp. SSBR45G]|uniref:hypothetical protein n=1 Tax=unclassified Bradyrhizobium TaxID=2631580 RepID=UPI0023428DC3|nr:MULTISPECIES: hypothetical protein [unclassified Bradyrhizobium]GLH77975.1 hypothetical protein SSBR45G_28830 [Bradyrhizobium sp. SSBR45G]GLH85403.1 hypothetical protein SSBR45R_28630 [Bradyrhizobium sp. SSBR45R]